jgi:very-short-patch-repair endonuclease
MGIPSSDKKLRNFKKELEYLKSHNLELLSYIDDCMNFSYTDKLLFRCKKCFRLFLSSLSPNVTCNTCCTKETAEKELYDWVSQYTKCIFHDRSVLDNGHELDIYCPDKKIAIEFDGLFWHSKKDSDYHKKKSEECAAKGIHLIHIFEDEWYYKRNIIKSRLRNFLSVTRFRLQARKCCVQYITKNQADRFLEKYHLQGSVSGSVYLGLFYKDRLVSVMVFGKPKTDKRFNKKFKWELLRFCTVSSFTVVGAAGKLLSFFRKQYEGSIITYVDLRFSTGHSYSKIGFKPYGFTEPNYFYTKSLVRLPQSKCKKSMLKTLLGSMFNNEFSETKNMSNAGFNKIWDCGNLIFVIE